MRVRTLAFGFSFFSGTMNQPAGISFVVNVNVRAEERAVNSQKMVQREEIRFAKRVRSPELLYAKQGYWRALRVIATVIDDGAHLA